MSPLEEEGAEGEGLLNVGQREGTRIYAEEGKEEAALPRREGTQSAAAGLSLPAGPSLASASTVRPSVLDVRAPACPPACLPTLPYSTLPHSARSW